VFWRISASTCPSILGFDIQIITQRARTERSDFRLRLLHHRFKSLDLPNTILNLANGVARYDAD